jgi:hypothetical protein
MKPGIVINFLAFQAGWFVCILGGNSPWLLLVVLYIALHLYMHNQWPEIKLIAAGTCTGFFLDTMLQVSGTISFADANQLQPFWLLVLWLLF